MHTGGHTVPVVQQGNAGSTKGNYVSADERAAETGGKLLYGLDRELAEKAAAKYDRKMEAEAREWIEAVTGTTLEGTLHEALKSGVVLCNLVNTIKPGACPAPKDRSMPFIQMENIANYLAACTKLGMPAHSSFQTVSLYEEQDMMAVLTNLHTLGSLAASVGYAGPTIGAKLATANAREFTEAQLNAGKAAQTFIGAGASATPGAALSHAHEGKKIVQGNIAGTENLGKGGEQTLVGVGGTQSVAAAHGIANLEGDRIVRGQ